MAYAPLAIQHLYTLILSRIPQAVLSGIVGDVHHSFGYHLSRKELPGDDYSVVLPKDRLGDSGAASALDISLPSGLMITCTNRLLIAAKKHDSRLAALREFCGTTDGWRTHPYDLSRGQDGPLDSWDSSHLWHIHLSFYREYENNATILAPIADVLAGKKTPPNPAPLPEEDDEMRIVKNAKRQALALQVRGIDEVRVLQEGQRAALEAAGFPVKEVSDAYYTELRNVAKV